MSQKATVQIHGGTGSKQTENMVLKYYVVSIVLLNFSPRTVGYECKGLSKAGITTCDHMDGH